MKAKNPDGGPDIDVAIPSGPSYTRFNKVCKDCGFLAGGCVAGPGLPEPYVDPRAICPKCRGKNLVLVEA